MQTSVGLLTQPKKTMSRDQVRDPKGAAWRQTDDKWGLKVMENAEASGGVETGQIPAHPAWPRVKVLNSWLHRSTRSSLLAGDKML